MHPLPGQKSLKKVSSVESYSKHAHGKGGRWA
jgi:hypothetical protein